MGPREHKTPKVRDISNRFSHIENNKLDERGTETHAAGEDWGGGKGEGPSKDRTNVPWI